MAPSNKYFAKRKQVDEWLTQEVMSARPGLFIWGYKGPFGWRQDRDIEQNWNTYEFISWIFGEQTVEYDLSSYLVEQSGIDIPLEQDLIKSGNNSNSVLKFTLKDGSQLSLRAKSYKYQEGKPVWWEQSNGWNLLNDSWEWPVRIYVTLPNKETIVTYPDYQMGGWDWEFETNQSDPQSINYRQLKL